MGAEKSYFPATYYFYCGVLLLCFGGTVKQWNSWKTVSWIAAIMVIIAMLVPVLNAWLPTPLLTAEGLGIWNWVILGVSITMIGYVAIAMYQVKRWMDEARDANYSNPDGFPADYANRVWLIPVFLTPLVWPAYIFDSPRLMAIQNVLLAIANIYILLTLMPVWRRKAILSHVETDQIPPPDTALEEKLNQTAVEIGAYMRDEKAYLNDHLKLDDVVEHCRHGRTYVSLAIQHHFGSFAAYVNGLRLEHYEQYIAEHPNETKESAALASGFTSYNAYYRAKQKAEHGK